MSLTIFGHKTGISFIEQRLQIIAEASEPSDFFDRVLVIEESDKRILNDLAPQVLATDNKKLISLFRRAVRNHDTLNPNKQVDPIPLYNKHYKKPPFLIPETYLELNVQEDHVEVTTWLKVKRNSKADWLILDAKDHEVVEIKVDWTVLPPECYKVTKHEIIIYTIPKNQDNKEFDVEIVSKIRPFENDSGQGLYTCGKWLTTQCESEGARGIFPTLDRPDVLSKYTTTIVADGEKYPYCISNGNLVTEHRNGKTGRILLEWEDPFPKPSYLFATVMGDFGVLEDIFITRSGRSVKLEVFMEKGKEERAKFSLWALKMAMKYEEEFFDREYDLDSLKMVAMPKFNAGAMENKGLIIFNESAILVDPTCATDQDYLFVIMVISHEYCHNWSGNRVTVRNWFELALKEAFTDFRCSQFMNWLFGAELIRPHEVKVLRERQFPQDASPNAHPIQVESYITSDEIYDGTTYIKGREVFRMLKTILDSKKENGFRLAQNAYFDKYDGQAVTFNELLEILQTVSKVDLDQFRRWFDQPGTPTIKAAMFKDGSIFCVQTCPHPKTKESQENFHIPLYFEMLDRNGNVTYPKTLSEIRNSMIFVGPTEKSIPVFNHDFSAPIRVEYEYTNEELEVIIQHASDPFARHEAIGIYLKRVLNEAYQAAKSSQDYTLSQEMIKFYESVLKGDKLSPLLKAALFELPTIRSIVEKDEVYDFQAAKKAQDMVKRGLVNMDLILLELLYTQYPDPKTYDPTSPDFKDEIAIRRLRNTCYAQLSENPLLFGEMIIKDYETAKNFNNQFELLKVIVEMDYPGKDNLLHEFFCIWKDDPTILCNWIDLQTGASNCTAESLERIFNTDGFKKDNPDHMRSLIRTFVNNLAAYHANPEANYKHVTDIILEFAEINQSVASHYLAEDAFMDYAKLPPQLKSLMQVQLERLKEPGVCLELRAIADKHLKG